MKRAAKLHRFARQIAGKLEKDKPPFPTQEMLAYLDENLEGVIDSLEGFVGQLDREGDKAAALGAAYLILMSVQLEYLRYRTDRNYAWAEELLDAFQQKLVAFARAGVLSGPDLAEVAGALHEAKIQPSPELVAVNEELMLTEESADIDPGDIGSMLETIAEEHGSDVFAIADSLAEIGHVMPGEFRTFLAAQMALSPIPVIRETAALTLLDPAKEVRRDTALALMNCAGALTPTALRRLIVIRNWLPEDERDPIDRLVRAARTKGVDCAPWAPGGTSEIFASAIDGSGAQGFLAVSREGKRYRCSSLLLRQGGGFIDAWSGEPGTKRQVNQTIEQAGDAVPMLTVSRDHVDRVVCHHLAAGLEEGAVPPLGLIQVAETIRAVDWRPAKLDWREAVEDLAGQLPEVFQDPDAVAAVLEVSGITAEKLGLADIWFEDDQEVRDFLAGCGTRQIEKLTRRVLDEIVEPRKLVWAERFLWLALWLKEAPEDHALLWPQFTLLARELARGRPAREIPLMEEIALTTVTLLQD